MNILMISANPATSPYPVFPLGMSMVSAALKAKGHEVEQFDFLQHNKSLETLQEVTRSVAPELIGLSVRNVDNVNIIKEERYLDTIETVVTAVHAVSTAPVILGGSGFSVIPEPVLAKTGADYGIVGEGEVAMLEFIAELEQGRKPKERILYAEKMLSDKQIPRASYDADMLAYYQEKGCIASVQTKRGCNKHCIYCSYPVLEGRDIRLRNPRDVVDDLIYLRDEHGTKHVFFVDSVFNDSQDCFRALIEEMLARKLTLPWTAFFTPGPTLDDDIVAKMRDTGLEAAEIGADAASDTALKGLGKNFRFDDVVACNELFLKHGVPTAFYYMFGGPLETKQTVLEGIDNIGALRQTANFIFMGIRILPGTPLAKIALREGVIGPDHDLLDSVYYISPELDPDWLEQTLTEGFADKYNCVFPPNTMDDKLQLLHKIGYSSAAAYGMLGKTTGSKES